MEIIQRVAKGRRMEDTNPTRLYAWKVVVSPLQAALLYLTSLSSFLLPPVSKANPAAGCRTYSGSNPAQGSQKASAVTSSHLLQFFTFQYLLGFFFFFLSRYFTGGVLHVCFHSSGSSPVLDLTRLLRT